MRGGGDDTPAHAVEPDELAIRRYDMQRTQLQITALAVAAIARALSARSTGSNVAMIERRG
jgi:hypothetical protein